MSAPQQEITGLRTGLGLGLGGGIGLLLASLLTSTSRWDWWPVLGWASSSERSPTSRDRGLREYEERENQGRRMRASRCARSFVVVSASIDVAEPPAHWSRTDKEAQR